MTIEVNKQERALIISALHFFERSCIKMAVEAIYNDEISGVKTGEAFLSLRDDLLDLRRKLNKDDCSR